MPLFIGGPLDGRLVEVDDARQYVEVATEHPISDVVILTKPNKLTDIFYYKREIINCPGIEIPVFVPRSYTCEHVINRLIEGYHQGAIQNIQN